MPEISISGPPPLTRIYNQGPGRYNWHEFQIRASESYLAPALSRGWSAQILLGLSNYFIGFI
jgi:hypothetical protein